jgi:hypothetical protein
MASVQSIAEGQPSLQDLKNFRFGSLGMLLSDTFHRDPASHLE